jgi:hypothetical protein
MKVRVLLAVFSAMAVAIPAVTFADDDIVRITVTGEGISQEMARKDALRKALEEGGKVEITSHSNVENFELIRDTIYSRSAGIVKDYKVLQEGAGAGGIYFCKIEADVSKSAVATAWGDVQNVLDQIGRPKIMVWIDETIDNALDTSSILESKIEERLIKSGFDVYARSQIEAIAEKEAADAAADDDIIKPQAIAKRFDCQIFIRGNANANGAGVEDLYGVPAAFYNCDAMVKTFHTDTARLLASESIPTTRRGARGQFSHSPQAAKAALAAAGEEIIEKTYVTVMEQWATQISAGGEIRLEISNIKAGPALKLKKMLAEIEGVEKVNGPDLSKGEANFRIVAKMSAEDLAQILVDGDWASIIEVEDIKLNRIQAKGL